MTFLILIGSPWRFSVMLNSELTPIQKYFGVSVHASLLFDGSGFHFLLKTQWVLSIEETCISRVAGTSLDKKEGHGGQKQGLNMSRTMDIVKIQFSITL